MVMAPHLVKEDRARDVSPESFPGDPPIEGPCSSRPGREDGYDDCSEPHPWRDELLALAAKHQGELAELAEEQCSNHQTELARLLARQQRALFDRINGCLVDQPRTATADSEGASFIARVPEVEKEPLLVDMLPETAHQTHDTTIPESTHIHGQSSADCGHWEIATATGWKKYYQVNMDELNVGDVARAKAHGHHYKVTRTGETTGEQRNTDTNRVRRLRVHFDAHTDHQNSVYERVAKFHTSVASHMHSHHTVHAHAETWVSIVIFLNTFVLVMSFEWQGWQTSVDLGISEASESWPDAGIWFEVSEHFFTVFFLAELTFMLYRRGCPYMKDWFHVLDAALVLVTCIELYILTPLRVDVVGNMTMLRVMRLAKLVRTLRVVRTVEWFSGLRVLVKAVSSSFLALFWAMVLLGMCILVSSLLMVALTQNIIEDKNNDFSLRSWAWKHYGTSSRSAYTMYEATFSGCWPNYVRPLLDEGFFGSYMVVFLVYITFVVFAVIRVITAIFLKETLDAAARDADMMMMERTTSRKKYLAKLEEVFRKADESGDGELSMDEFNHLFKDPALAVHWKALDLEVHEGLALFEMLDDGDGVISYEEFVKGVSRMKGTARSVDMVQLHIEIKKLARQVQELSQKRDHP